MSKAEWWAYCVELDSKGETLKTLRKRSPNWDPDFPQVFINTGTTDPRVLFADGFCEAKKKDVARYGRRLREDLLCVGGLTKEQALRTRSRTTQQLREEGFGVLNPKPIRNHYVYVIDLDPAVREEDRVRRENPNADPSMPCVYVGQTGKTLKSRRHQHRKGKKAGRGYVTKYGFGRPYLKELFERLNPCYPEDALKYERELAEDLRAQGYTVTGGH